MAIKDSFTAEDGLSGLFKGLTPDQAKGKAVEAIKAVGALGLNA